MRSWSRWSGQLGGQDDGQDNCPPNGLGSWIVKMMVKMIFKVDGIMGKNEGQHGHLLLVVVVVVVKFMAGHPPGQGLYLVRVAG
jgi:hypothetical protein